MSDQVQSRSPSAFQWARVAQQAMRRIPYSHEDRAEQVRLLKSIEREAGDLAGVIGQDFAWPERKGQGRV